MVWKNSLLELPENKREIILYNSGYYLGYYNCEEKYFAVNSLLSKGKLLPNSSLFWKELDFPLLPDIKTNPNTILKKINYYLEIGGTHYIECVTRNSYIIIRVSDKVMNQCGEFVLTGKYLSIVSKSAERQKHWKNLSEYFEYEDNIEAKLMVYGIKHEIIKNVNSLIQYVIVICTNYSGNKTYFVAETGYLPTYAAEERMFERVQLFDMFLINDFITNGNHLRHSPGMDQVYTLGDREYDHTFLSQSILLHFIDELDQDGPIFEALLNHFKNKKTS